jgi:REP element-mobilizing transposase RayT
MDLRKGRYSAPDQIYLITAATAERKTLFSDWPTGRLLVCELKRVADAGIANSLAWVIMPDHFHWLLELKTGDLSSVLCTVKSRSAIAINKHIGSTGKIWQKGFHDHAVRSEEDIRSIARYIVANPLRARITDRIGNYPLWDAAWV